MEQPGRTRRRDFLKAIVSIPPALGETLRSPGRPSGRPARPRAEAGRARIVLSEGWRVKQLESDAPEAGRLALEAFAPDSRWLSARLPAEIHEILLAHGLIRDPHIGKNAADSAWVGEKDWAYAGRFVSPPGSGGPVFLCFEGLDTLASVHLNGREIGRYNNMFREYRVDVRDHLAPEGDPNTLLIVFSSPLRYIDRFPQPREHVGVIAKHKYLRKSHGDFGSYLGARPHSVKVGIHRDIVLDVPGRAWIEDLWIQTRLSPDLKKAALLVAVELEGAPGTLAWSLLDPAGAQAARGSLDAKPGRTEFGIDVSAPELWWPHTHGIPSLYTLNLELRDRGRLVDERAAAVGIRDVKLIQKDAGTGEKRFRFDVNGRPVAMLGACWTPPEGLTHCWPRERANRLLDLAEAGSMNVLRLWAEGYVPPREFYDECDRRGIFVWQDFMFGYGMTPSGIPEYDANCRAEIEGIVRRLRNHPCLLLWVGGNENQMALDFAGMTSDVGRDLFEKTMPGICAVLDPGRAFHPSSPFGGPVPNWPLEGDFHDYTAESFSPEASVPAFTSEVGRVTAPSLRNMRRFLSDEEIWPPGFDPSIKKPGQPAWPPMWQYRTFNDAWDWVAPYGSYCDPRSASDLIRLIGTAHGEHLRERIERQRRGVPDGAPAGSRRNWGNLVWCFNDSRPVIQFGMIDYYLEPKIPYDFVRRAYEPVLVCFERTADRIFAWIVNDSPGPVSSRLNVKRMRFDGTVRDALSADVTVPPGESKRCLDLTDFGPLPLRHEFLWAQFGDREVTALLSGERHLNLPQARLNAEVREGKVRLSSDVFARQVSVEAEGEPGVVFDDNHFDLPPKTVRTIGALDPLAGRRLFIRALNADQIDVVL